MDDLLQNLWSFKIYIQAKTFYKLPIHNLTCSHFSGCADATDRTDARSWCRTDGLHANHHHNNHDAILCDGHCNHAHHNNNYHGYVSRHTATAAVCLR